MRQLSGVLSGLMGAVTGYAMIAGNEQLLAEVFEAIKYGFWFVCVWAGGGAVIRRLVGCQPVEPP